MVNNVRTNYLTGAEALVRLLDAHEVKYIFGLCGDTTLPFYDALYRLNHSIKHILTRDERSASYMADGYARVTGKVGICEGPSGGGATYIIPGVVEANESSISVIAITSDVPTSSIGHFPLTELNQKELFKPLTKWNEKIDNAKNLGKLVRKSFEESTSGRPGACHLCFPFDIQKAEVAEEDIWVNKEFSKFPALPKAPDPSKVDQIIKEIMKSKKPMIICGGAIKNSFAEKELQKLVEKTNIVLATSVTGKGTLADTHPNCLGVVGSNGGSIHTREITKNSDLIIFIGCRAGSVTTEKWQYPNKKTKIISSVGFNSRELFFLRKREKITNGKDFLLVGGMGHTAMTALSMTKYTKSQVICMDGDGSFIMHMGSLSILNNFNSPNFKYILIDNEAHESIGLQPISINKVDFKKLSKSLGFKNFYLINSKNEIKKNITKLLNNKGPSFMHVKIKTGTLENLPRPKDFISIKRNFMIN